MTPGEVALVIEGARWRNEQASQLAYGAAIVAAWNTAAWMRSSERMPSLKSILDKLERGDEPPEPQTEEQISAGLREWAEDMRAKGMAVWYERHETPVISTEPTNG